MDPNTSSDIRSNNTCGPWIPYSLHQTCIGPRWSAEHSSVRAAWGSWDILRHSPVLAREQLWEKKVIKIKLRISYLQPNQMNIGRKLHSDLLGLVWAHNSHRGRQKNLEARSASQPTTALWLKTICVNWLLRLLSFSFCSKTIRMNTEDNSELYFK